MSVPPEIMNQMMQQQQMGQGIMQPQQVSMGQQMPMQQQQQPQQEPYQPAQDNQKQQILELEALTRSVNIAQDLDDELLDEIAGDLCTRIKEDEQSMEAWLRRYNDYIKLALQVKESKTFPWRGAANVKYPLLTIASLQFHARAYPALVDPRALVKGKVVGYDPSGEKANRAERVGKHMTYQLIDQISNWDDDMDKLCLILPITGCAFKKVEWDEFEQAISSTLILPTEIIVNYWAKSLEDARRITHKLYMYENTILERQRAGIFRDIELSPPQMRGKSHDEEKNQLREFHGSKAEDIPYCVYECHTLLDLDDDGYKEPYIVVIEPNDRKILRIAPNYDLSDVKKNGKGQIVRIRPKQNFIQFNFIPAPDGGLLGVGFGLLLGSLNEVVNSSINQLLDQGTMATTAGGFISKGIKLKGGRMSFEPNEWKMVQTSGDDLRKGIVPLPIKEPSPTLFQLLQAVVASGKEIIAISEIATGKLPGQNTPATTTMSAIDEGMKLFTAIYKRIHRSLKKEFKRIFELNRVYMQDEEYYTILDSKGNVQSDGMVSKADYNEEDLDVIPESDPNAASDMLKLMKAQALLELIPTGAVDPVKAGQRILEAMDQPNIQELAPQPQPDPKVQLLQMKGQIDQQSAQQDSQIKAQDAQLKMQMKQQEMAFKEKEMQMQGQMQAMEQRMKEMDAMMKLHMQQQEHRMTMKEESEKHQMMMMHKEEEHKMKMKEKNGADKKE